ncbi:hypothetical protein [Melittangium boletus]|uniref:hypothetical protein n=1 Tax=Melittangium boletus TaxID=83453 RepID=UPI003DA4A426
MGRLASRLAQGVLPGVFAPRRGAVDKSGPRSPTERGARREGVAREPDGAFHAFDPEQAGAASQGKRKTEQGLLGAAFAALKRARAKQLKKASRKKKAGAAHALDQNHLADDDTEDVVSRPMLKAWLRGDDPEEDTFGEVRREAKLLERMESQGASPSHILEELNGKLGGARGSQYKRMLSTEVRSHMDQLAERVGQVSTDERRRLASLVSRAVHQVGTQNAPTFDKLLVSTATAEAQHLAGSHASVTARAEEFTLALQRAASATYRATLVDKGRASIEKLAADAARAPAASLQLVLACMLRAAHLLPGPSVTTLADGFAAGWVSEPGRPASDALPQTLVPALRAEPGGAFWAVQLMLVFAGRGEAVLTQQLADGLHGLIREARQRCYPTLVELKAAGSPTARTAKTQELWRRLDETAVQVAEVLPTCGAIWALQERVPIALAVEALLALGALDGVGASAPGQRMLRAALLTQERNEWSFLNLVPQLAGALADPRVVPVLEDSGLVGAHYQNGGQVYLRRVATQTGRALIAPVVARSQRGEALAARLLMSSALYLNAELFGLSPEGAGIAVDLLDALRAKPNPAQARSYLARLEELGQRYPSGTGSVESLREFVVALTRRDPQAVKNQAPTRQEADDAPRLTALDVQAVQTTLLKEKQAQREALEQKQREAASKTRAQPGTRPPPRR